MLPLPLLAEGTDLELESPGAFGLLIQQPIGFRDRGWRHQGIGVIKRVGTEGLYPSLTYPFGVDAGIDDKMGDMDILGTQFPRGRLGDSPQAELGAGKGRIAASAAQTRCRTGEED